MWDTFLSTHPVVYPVLHWVVASLSRVYISDSLTVSVRGRIACWVRIEMWLHGWVSVYVRADVVYLNWNQSV